MAEDAVSHVSSWLKAPDQDPPAVHDPLITLIEEQKRIEQLYDEVDARAMALEQERAAIDDQLGDLFWRIRTTPASSFEGLTRQLENGDGDVLSGDFLDALLAGVKRLAAAARTDGAPRSPEAGARRGVSS